MICFCRIMIKWDKMTDVQDCNNMNLELITRGISTILRMQMSFSLAGYMMISKTKTIHFISSLESIHPIPLHPPSIPRFLLTSNLQLDKLYLLSKWQKPFLLLRLVSRTLSQTLRTRFSFLKSFQILFSHIHSFQSREFSQSVDKRQVYSLCSLRIDR